MSLRGQAIRGPYVGMCKPCSHGLGSIPSKGRRKEKQPNWKNDVLIEKLVVSASSWNPSIWEAEARGLPRVQGQPGQVLCQS